MCVEWVNDWETAPEDMTAYKVVRKVKGAFGRYKYRSPTNPTIRADQGYGLNGGKVLSYQLGKSIKSDEPGIYCLAHPFALAGDQETALLEVVIPKGTKFRRGKAGVRNKDGQTFELRTLNALMVKVGKLFKGAVDGTFLWPVASRTIQYTWTYTVTNSTCTIVNIQQPG